MKKNIMKSYKKIKQEVVGSKIKMLLYIKNVWNVGLTLEMLIKCIYLSILIYWYLLNFHYLVFNEEKCCKKKNRRC